MKGFSYFAYAKRENQELRDGLHGFLMNAPRHISYALRSLILGLLMCKSVMVGGEINYETDFSTKIYSGLITNAKEWPVSCG